MFTAHRIGQTKEVRIFRFVTTHSVEEQILGVAQQKLDMDGKVIQAGKFDQKSTAEEREEFLRALLDTTNDDEENKINDINDDDELNEILARNEDETILFKKMDSERSKEEKQIWFKNPLTKKEEFPANRLLRENEIPQDYLQGLDQTLDDLKEDPEILGRGNARAAANSTKIYDGKNKKNKAKIFYQKFFSDLIFFSFPLHMFIIYISNR